MSWLKRFSLVIHSNMTAFVERFEDPERILNQLIIDMEDELQRVRAGTAGVIADEIQLGKRALQSRAEADQWQERAATALRRNDETAARLALEQKVRAAQRADALAVQHRRQQDETARLQSAVLDLEDKIRQANQRRALLLARLTRADSARRIGDVLKQVEGTSALSQFQRMEDRALRAEAMEEAHLRLEGRDPGAEALARSFADQERQEALHRELDELKKRLQAEG